MFSGRGMTGHPSIRLVQRRLLEYRYLDPLPSEVQGAPIRLPDHADLESVLSVDS